MTSLLPAAMLGVLCLVAPTESTHEEPATSSAHTAAPHTDLADWQFWWYFNRERILDLRARARAPHPELVPGPKQVVEEVVPLLQQILKEEADPDLLGSAAVALGKCARQLDAQEPTLAALRPLLGHENAEVAESAVLALGLTGAPAAAADLAPRATDTDAPVRIRGRALYALCLLADLAADAEVETATLRTAQSVLAEAVANPERATDLAVAAIIALSALGQAEDPRRTAELLEDALQTLDGLPDDLPEQTLAHVPIATARLLRRGHQRGLPGSTARLRVRLGKWRTNLDDLLEDPPPVPPPLPDPPPGVWAPRSDPEFELPVTRSIVSAVGMTVGLVADPNDPEPWTSLLIRVFESPLERQTRYLALMALGESGDEAAVAHLLTVLESTDDFGARNWSALALGVQAASHPELDAARAERIAEALIARIENRDDDQDLQSIVVALGLLGAPQAIEPLRALLPRMKARDELCGRITVALGLLGDQDSRQSIRTLFDASARRPARAQFLAEALLLLGDRGWIAIATERLRPGNLAGMSMAAVQLGLSSDRRALPALSDLARDEDGRALQRAFAVVALGTLCDPDPTTWTTPIADHVAYRSAPPTLTDQMGGVLDIL